MNSVRDLVASGELFNDVEICSDILDFFLKSSYVWHSVNICLIVSWTPHEGQIGVSSLFIR